MKLNPLSIVGLLLIVAGVAGFLLKDFSYTRDTTAAKLGTFELKVEQQETVSIPAWLSGGAIAIGALLLVIGGRRR